TPYRHPEPPVTAADPLPRPGREQNERKDPDRKRAGQGGGAGPAAPDQFAGRLRAALHGILPLLRGGRRIHPDLTPSRLTALAELHTAERPLRISELAARTGIALSTASRMVDLLAASGWIDRHPDPADQRASLISLSEEGDTLLRTVRRETESALCHAILRLDPVRREQLRQALPVLEALARQARHPEPPR
ncbi:MarR family winged helix-turn-helix transcriptional regulator, partial [Streptomyces clavuligerus]